MDIELLEKELRKKICDTIEIVPDGANKFFIGVPFTFGDGDFLNVILKRNRICWYFTDEGHTFMHLSYEDLDFNHGKRKEILDSILKTHDIENDNGELISEVEDDNFGDTFYTFIQGIIKVTDIVLTKKEHITTLFYEEFRNYLTEILGDKCIFDYTDPDRDPDGIYPVDCYIKNKVPVFIFAVKNDDKCSVATITCHHYEKLGVPFNSIGIFENQGGIGKKPLARFTDIVEKQYSSLPSAKERLPEYLKKIEVLN